MPKRKKTSVPPASGSDKGLAIRIIAGGTSLVRLHKTAVDSLAPPQGGMLLPFDRYKFLHAHYITHPPPGATTAWVYHIYGICSEGFYPQAPNKGRCPLTPLGTQSPDPVCVNVIPHFGGLHLRV